MSFFQKYKYLLIYFLSIHYLVLLICPVFLTGILAIFFYTPIDFQQGEMYKFMFMHVPFAWFSLILYSLLSGMSIIFLITKLDVIFTIVKSINKYGLVYTSLTLASGFLWSKPAWGFYWVWDPRLLNMILLFLMFFGNYLLINLLQHQDNYKKISTIFVVFGFLALPLIKHSVEWWASLHQDTSYNLLQFAMEESSVLTILNIILITTFNIILFIISLEVKEKYILRKEKERLIQSE